MAIVIALDLLYQDFDPTITSLLETNEKSIYKIQSILQSKKAKNLSKQAIEVVANLAMAFKDKENAPKIRKIISEDECYNCHNLGHSG